MNWIIISIIVFMMILFGFIIGYGCGFIAGTEYINKQLKELNDSIKERLSK